MIQKETLLTVADNSGAKRALCIGILGNSRQRYATVGDVIKVSVKKALPNSNMKKKTVTKAIIVRVKKEVRRKDGSYVAFDDNAVVLVDNNLNPRGTRVFGPVARELREKDYLKIVSLAVEVV